MGKCSASKSHSIPRQSRAQRLVVKVNSKIILSLILMLESNLNMVLGTPVGKWKLQERYLNATQLNSHFSYYKFWL